MRKSILMGTREDVLKRRNKQTTIEPVFTPVHSIPSNSPAKRTIVTFNHPSIMESK